MFLFRSQITTPGQLEQIEREKLLGGRKSLACHESPGPDENSSEKGLTLQWNVSINLKYSHSAKLAWKHLNTHWRQASPLQEMTPFCKKNNELFEDRFFNMNYSPT